MIDVPSVVIEAPAKAPFALSTLTNAERSALAGFRAANGVQLVDVPADATATPIAIDPEADARIARVEATLHAARGPLDLGDRAAIDGLRARVSAAYADVRAHPEAPEAPFLLAEALRTLARIEDLAGDADAGRALRARASLLDGGRSIGLSEGEPNEGEKPARRDVAFTLVGEHAAAVLFVDGAPRSDTTVPLAAGEHHVRVATDDGATLAAAWIAIGATGGVTLRVGPDATPCSRADLAPALARVAAGNDEGFAVRCEKFAIVTRAPKHVDVRLCDRTGCERKSTWSTQPLLPPPPPPPEQHGLFHSGWTWAAIGAAAVAGGTLTAWRLGAFDRPAAPPPTWRWDGAH